MGLLSLRAKQYSEAPKNVKCLPLNATTFKVTFEGPQNYRVRKLNKLFDWLNFNSNLPYNLCVVLFQWSAVTTYIASRHEPKFSTHMLHDLNSRVQNEFVVPDSGRPPFEPIMLYFRGMEQIGADAKTKGGTTAFQIQYDMSRLSDGIRCATQGCKCFLLIWFYCFLTSFLWPREIKSRTISNV